MTRRGLIRRQVAVLAIGALLMLVTGCSGQDATDPSELAAGATSSSTPATGGGEPAEPALRLVAIGDSIPDTLSWECPGCTGFVDRYADASSQATGREVESENYSDHTSKTLPMLLDQLPSLEEDLRAADAIIVGIAHNSILLNADAPCGTTWDEDASTFKDWSRITAECAEDSAAEYRPMYDELFATIAAWRKGQPTVLRTINKYSDWIGWEGAHLTADQEHRTVLVHDAWNKMLCASAERHGFACADIYHAFNGPRGERASGDLLGADYTHPSDKGNARIAELLIAQGFGPLTAR